MLDIGERLRAARLSQDLSLRELAVRAEVSASLLSQIENGKANPSVRSLHRIADALSLPVDYFFLTRDEGEPENASSLEAGSNVTARERQAIQVAASADGSKTGFEDQAQSFESVIVRRRARPTVELKGGVTWSRLTPGPEDEIEFLQICYEVGASSGKEMSRHVGREFGLVLEGELWLELGFERYLLRPGDSVIFDSTTPHRLTNAGQVSVRAVWIVMV